MSRVIVGMPDPTPGAKNAAPAKGEEKKDKPDGYLERVVKFIPAEVVAFYVFVNSLLAGLAKEPLSALPSAAKSEEIIKALATTRLANGSVSLLAVSNSILLLGACMSVIYLYIQHNSENKSEYLRLNAGVSFVGFFVWAYAVDAVALRPWHDGVLASVLLASFSLISGAFSPAAQDKVADTMGGFKRATFDRVFSPSQK